jgi:DNA-binding NtrC family response regulator
MDVGPIARALLRDLALEIGARELTPCGLARLQIHAWPGNVRELRNVLLRAADAADAANRASSLDVRAIEAGLRVRESKPPLNFTPQLAREWLARHGGNMSAAARSAGYARTTFRKLLLEAGVGGAGDGEE